MRHQAEDVPCLVADTRHVGDGAVRVFAHGVAQDDLAAAVARGSPPSSCQTRWARAPTRSRAETASRSSFEPGKTGTATSGRSTAALTPVLGTRSRSSRSAGWRAVARTCARAAYALRPRRAL